jgi:hypothetical protein
MLTTLSQITPPRDGGSLAMSIGPVPPPPCFPVNYAICLRSFPNDDVLSPLGGVVGRHWATWKASRRTEPAPYIGATGHDGPSPLQGPSTASTGSARRGDGTLRSRSLLGPPRPTEPAPYVGATGYDGLEVHWECHRPLEPAPNIGATGHEGVPAGWDLGLALVANRIGRNSGLCS